MANQTTRYDIVIAGGRVIDPESGLDAIRNVGIGAGSVEAVSAWIMCRARSARSSVSGACLW